MEAESPKQNFEAESAEPDQSSFGLSALSCNLKIGYDGKRAANNLTGLGNYSRSLIEYLSKQFSGNQYFIYTPRIKAKIKKLSLKQSSDKNLQKNFSTLFHLQIHTHFF